MTYLERIEATPAEQRWPLVRTLMREEPLPFFAEMRASRPVLVLPELTLAFRMADCVLILRRHKDFGVDLYVPKQGDYFMAQDDTAAHWREKSIMKAVLDFERIPEIRTFVAKRTADILRGAGGTIDLPKAITRAVPVAVVQTFFGLDQRDASDLIQWSYWNQQDAFHNQPFDDAPDPAKIIRERKAANIRLALYIGRLVAQRSVAVKLGRGSDDIVSRLLRLSFSGGVDFSWKRVLFNSGGLLIGAVETTSHAVCNIVGELLSRPEMLDEAHRVARAEAPDAFDGVAMEALRFRPAFPLFFRTCHRETELAGGTPFATSVRPGTTVLAVTHSAMFDPASFNAPETFDRHRSQGDNFTLGFGIHECLGRAIAKPMFSEIARQIVSLSGLRANGPLVLGNKVPESMPVAWNG